MSSATTQGVTLAFYYSNVSHPRFLHCVEHIVYPGTEPLDEATCFAVVVGPRVPWRAAIAAAREWADGVEFNLLPGPGDHLADSDVGDRGPPAWLAFGGVDSFRSAA